MILKMRFLHLDSKTRNWYLNNNNVVRLKIPIKYIDNIELRINRVNKISILYIDILYF